MDIKEQIKGREAEFDYVDIGTHVKLLKEFMRIRDTSPVFEEARKEGYAGIPCFVLENGDVSLTPEDAGLETHERTPEMIQACSIEDHLNHVGGC